VRAVQYVHAHELHSAVSGEAAGWGAVGQQMEDPEGIAGPIKLVTRVAREVEAEILVMVQNRRVYGAV